MPSNQILIEKTKEVEQLKNLINRYKVIAAASLHKIRASQLQELRRKLEDSAYFRVTKNTLIKRAIAESKDKPKIIDFGEAITGSSVFLFTNHNPFELVLILKKNKVKTNARAGDTSSDDVVVNSGNTGLPPGPIITQFTAAGLTTRIESGSVWINRDTTVAKKGDIISAELSAILSKLGIKPVEIELILNSVYDDGIIIDKDQLQIDLEKTKKTISEAHVIAFALSIEASYPTSDNIVYMLQESYRNVYNLALNSGIPTSETIKSLLLKAYIQMKRLQDAMTKS
jgi:large subunit ribosomal protein L10